MQKPLLWNLIGRSITVPPPVLSPSSILSPPSSHCAFIPGNKIRRALQKLSETAELEMA